MAIACSTSAWKGSLGEALEQITLLGFEYVDLIAIKGWNHIVPEELAADFKRLAGQAQQLLQRHRLKPVALNTAVAAPYQRNDITVNEQRLREAEALARLAASLGVDVVSFFPGPKWPAQEMERATVVEGQVRTIEELLAIGERHGVAFVMEPHYNTPFETLEQVRELLERAPHLCIAYDPSHFAMQSISPEDTEFLLDRASHVHLRDAAPEKMHVPLGTGTVDFDRLLRALNNNDYRGHISIEYLPSPEIDVAETTRLRDMAAVALSPA